MTVTAFSTPLGQRPPRLLQTMSETMHINSDSTYSLQREHVMTCIRLTNMQEHVQLGTTTLTMDGPPSAAPDPGTTYRKSDKPAEKAWVKDKYNPNHL